VQAALSGHLAELRASGAPSPRREVLE